MTNVAIRRRARQYCYGSCHELGLMNRWTRFLGRNKERDPSDADMSWVILRRTLILPLKFHPVATKSLGYSYDVEQFP